MAMYVIKLKATELNIEETIVNLPIVTMKTLKPRETSY